VIAIPALSLLFRRVIAERMGTIILSAFVAHTAWHWMLDRAALLQQYRFQLPPLDAAFAVGVMRVLMLLLMVAGLGWLLSTGVRRVAGGVAVGEATAE
jgi:hypothetical protein